MNQIDLEHFISIITVTHVFHRKIKLCSTVCLFFYSHSLHRNLLVRITFTVVFRLAVHVRYCGSPTNLYGAHSFSQINLLLYLFPFPFLHKKVIITLSIYSKWKMSFKTKEMFSIFDQKEITFNYKLLSSNITLILFACLVSFNMLFNICHKNVVYLELCEKPSREIVRTCESAILDDHVGHKNLT